MRAKDFIVEAQVDINQQVAANIKAHCQPFLKQLGFPQSGALALRGISDIRASGDLDALLAPIPVRTDRKPLNTAVPTHKIIDDWMTKKFGWPVRSQGLFASGAIETAQSYGLACAIFPIGNCSYIWSEEIDDMTVSVYRAIGAVAKSDELKRDYTDLTPKIIAMLEAGNWHVNEGLVRCLEEFQYTEVVFRAGSYYAVPIEDVGNGLNLVSVMEAM